jgi:hypothetical protein
MLSMHGASALLAAVQLLCVMAVLTFCTLSAGDHLCIASGCRPACHSYTAGCLCVLCAAVIM